MTIFHLYYIIDVYFILKKLTALDIFCFFQLLVTIAGLAHDVCRPLVEESKRLQYEQHYPLYPPEPKEASRIVREVSHLYRRRKSTYFEGHSLQGNLNGDVGSPIVNYFSLYGKGFELSMDTISNALKSTASKIDFKKYPLVVKALETFHNPPWAPKNF